ncbi:MAG: hypothetical protein HY327_12740 [Chloroflexi bacterium]|nr:hypothetical protein [Chloroflexota bacterium]
MDELQAVVQQIIAILIQITAALVALSVATGFLEAQIGYLLGAPSLMSKVWVTIGAVVICLVLALMAIPISNALVGILFP